MPAPISTTLKACMESFDEIKVRVEQPDYRHEEEIPSFIWTDELGRLNVWASNVEAHQTGHSSLESRLGNTSSTSQKFAEHVANMLIDLKSYLTETLLELSKAGPSACGDDGPSDASPKQPTELQQLHEQVANVIDNLNELSRSSEGVFVPILIMQARGPRWRMTKTQTLHRCEDSAHTSPMLCHLEQLMAKMGIVAVKDLGHDGHSVQTLKAPGRNFQEVINWRDMEGAA